MPCYNFVNDYDDDVEDADATCVISFEDFISLEKKLRKERRNKE
jgi:hypothetical protein